MTEQTQGWTNDDRPDWETISGEPPPPVDPGVYLCEVAAAKAQTTKNGHPSVGLELTIKAAANGSGIEGRSDKIKFETLALTKNALFRVKQFCDASGVAPPKSTAFGTIEEWSAGLPGTSVLVKVKHREGKNGGTFADVERYLTKAKAAELQSGDAAAAPARRKPRA